MTTSKGTYIAYTERKFNQESLETIGRINQLVSKYEAKGLTMTLRQIHYQFVINNLAPNNATTYNKLKSALNNGGLKILLFFSVQVALNRLTDLKGKPNGQDQGNLSQCGVLGPSQKRNPRSQ